MPLLSNHRPEDTLEVRMRMMLERFATETTAAMESVLGDLHARLRFAKDDLGVLAEWERTLRAKASEHLGIDLLEAHWFTQGAQQRYGDIGHSTSIDEAVAKIIRLVDRALDVDRRAAMNARARFESELGTERRIRQQVQQEASNWAGEARAQRHTVLEIYQIIRQRRGEPGDWHGAEPVRERIAALEAQIRQLGGEPQ